LAHLRLSRRLRLSNLLLARLLALGQGLLLALLLIAFLLLQLRRRCGTIVW
jgi:hypothetical protein